jgi:hypothetical protein
MMLRVFRDGIGVTLVMLRAYNALMMMMMSLNGEILMMQRVYKTQLLMMVNSMLMPQPYQE